MLRPSDSACPSKAMDEHNDCFVVIFGRVYDVQPRWPRFRLTRSPAHWFTAMGVESDERDEEDDPN